MKNLRNEIMNLEEFTDAYIDAYNQFNDGDCDYILQHGESGDFFDYEAIFVEDGDEKYFLVIHNEYNNIQDLEIRKDIQFVPQSNTWHQSTVEDAYDAYVTAVYMFVAALEAQNRFPIEDAVELHKQGSYPVYPEREETYSYINQDGSIVDRIVPYQQLPVIGSGRKLRRR